MRLFEEFHKIKIHFLDLFMGIFQLPVKFDSLVCLFGLKAYKSFWII